MKEPKSTKENVNKLIEFRQAVYEHGISYRRDAALDLLDALLSAGPVSSFAILSQAEAFQRKWSSVYAAVEDGRLTEDWLQAYLAQQAPKQGICMFALDGSPWLRPRARTLEDRQYVFQASSDVNGGTVAIGYRPDPNHDPHQKGRPRVRGARFAFKETDTWGEPDEVIELEDPRWDRCGCSGGKTCMKRRAWMCLTMWFAPVCILNERNRLLPCGWPGWRPRRYSPGWSSPQKPSGAPTTAAGRLNPGCISAKKPSAGPDLQRWPPG